MQSLKALFNPQSIAVVGASADEYKAGYQMLYALRGFPGRLYPINPKAENILGFKAYPTLKDVGKPLDLVILTVPAPACIEILKEAGEAGARSAMIISGGFAETGPVGEMVQRDMLSVCSESNIRLLGPNTAGFANPKAGVSANFTPWIGEMPKGPVGLVSQSGAMTLTLAALIHAQNLGISLAVGIGNGADVGVPDAVEYLAADEETEVILLYLEGVNEGRRLYDVVRTTTDKKPVVVLTVGRGDIGEFAVSHTGNLIGSYETKRAALRQAGAVMVDSGDDLIDAASLFSHVRLEPNKDPGVGLLTGQAGPGMVIADLLRRRGILIPELGAPTIAKIKEALPPLTFVRNPVDTSRPSPTFAQVLRAMAEEPAIHVLITFAIHEPAVIDPVSLFQEVKGQIKQPMVFGTAGFPESIRPTQRALSELNIPSFPSPDRTARTVWAMVEDAKAAYRKGRETRMSFSGTDLRPLRKAPDEAEAKALLGRIGIRTPRGAVCTTHEEAIKVFHGLPKPCVVKVLDATIAHKTEVGGVIFGIQTQRRLEDALARIDDIETRSGNRYLIEEMVEEGLEVIIGARNDPSFGATVLFGLGGTTAEAVKDVSVRLAPLDFSEALDMIGELRGSALLEEWRGAPSLDKVRVAETLVKVGHFMARHPEIKEMDINPVRVYERSLCALDALIVLNGTP